MATNDKKQTEAQVAKAKMDARREEVKAAADPQFYALLQKVRQQNPDVRIRYTLEVLPPLSPAKPVTGVVSHDTRPILS